MTNVTLPEQLLDEFAVVSFSEIVSASGFSAAELRELVELGLFEPRGRQGTEDVFAARTIEMARTARRLQMDFELPLTGVALTLTYRERVRELEEQLRRLLCQLPGGARG